MDLGSGGGRGGVGRGGESRQGGVGGAAGDNKGAGISRYNYYVFSYF